MVGLQRHELLPQLVGQLLFSKARSIRNALDRIRLGQANRLVVDLNSELTADDIMLMEASDVLASRVFLKSKSGS